VAALLINGSPHQDGNTAWALQAVARGLDQGGVASEVFWLGQQALGDCIACGACQGKNPPACVGLHDPGEERVAAFLKQATHYDAFVFASPVYYGHATGRLLSFMDRVFRAGGSLLQHKVAAAVAVARRAGTLATLEGIEKYFHLYQMPIATSTYWPVTFGRTKGEASFDQEGLATLEGLGQNIAWLVKAIKWGKQNQILPPALAPRPLTNMVRADLQNV